MKRVAIMQPYIFPYIGYFQLIHATNLFVFYDDVNFIKKGWINRNKILMQGKELSITFPCKKVSQNKLIREVEINGGKDYLKLLKTIETAYKKAPFFKEVFPLVQHVLHAPEVRFISDLAVNSVRLLSDYIGLKTTFKKSSAQLYNNRHFDKADRLIDIVKKEGSTAYINAIGGKALYDKAYFSAHGVHLSFLQPGITPYKQSDYAFIPGLSMLDVVMFNDKDTILRDILPDYKIV